MFRALEEQVKPVLPQDRRDRHQQLQDRDWVISLGKTRTMEMSPPVGNKSTGFDLRFWSTQVRYSECLIHFTSLPLLFSANTTFPFIVYRLLSRTTLTAFDRFELCTYHYHHIHWHNFSISQMFPRVG